MPDSAKFSAISLKPHIRWIIRKDMPSVLQIEQQCFEDPWTEADFALCLRQRNNIGMVAVIEESVCAFMIYELQRGGLFLLTMAVSRQVQGRGVGSRLVEKLVSKLSPNRRRFIATQVRERNLEALNFFKRKGFRATQVVRSPYLSSDEDGILMRYELEVPST